MTGTSADDIADFTLACFTHTGQVHHHANQAVTIEPSLRYALQHISEQPYHQISSQLLSDTEQALTEFLAFAYQKVIKNWGLSDYPKDKIILSPHGQTVYHAPHKGHTHQLLNADLLQRITGYPVAFGHRKACIQNSNAAPLAPLLLKTIWPHDEHCNIIINGGGIANITVLPENTQEIIGYDIGPANGPLDSLITHFIRCHSTLLPIDVKQKKYDINGNLAREGSLISSLYLKLSHHPYFMQPIHHKSADRSDFNLDWIGHDNLSAYSIHDLLHTVSMVVIDTITKAISRHASPSTSNSIYFYGGLAHNTFIIDSIKDKLALRPSLHFSDWAATGLDPNYIESLLMAYLGYCIHQHKSVDLSYCSNQATASCVPGYLLTHSRENHREQPN